MRLLHFTFHRSETKHTRTPNVAYLSGSGTDVVTRRHRLCLGHVLCRRRVRLPPRPPPLLRTLEQSLPCRNPVTATKTIAKPLPLNLAQKFRMGTCEFYCQDDREFSDDFPAVLFWFPDPTFVNKKGRIWTEIWSIQTEISFSNASDEQRFTKDKFLNSYSSLFDSEVQFLVIHDKSTVYSLQITKLHFFAQEFCLDKDAVHWCCRRGNRCRHKLQESRSQEGKSTYAACCPENKHKQSKKWKSQSQLGWIHGELWPSLNLLNWTPRPCWYFCQSRGH